MLKHLVIVVLCILVSVMSVIAAWQYNTIKRMSVRLASAEARLGISTGGSAGAGAALTGGVSAGVQNTPANPANPNQNATPEGAGAPLPEEQIGVKQHPADPSINGTKQKTSDAAPATSETASATMAASGSSSGQSAQDSAKSNGTPSRKKDKKTEKASEKATQQSNALLSKAQQHIQEGDYETAQVLLQESLAQDAGNTKAWKQLAQLQRQLGMTDAELQTYQQWMDSVSGDNDPYYMMAEALARIGMDDEAREYLAAFEDAAQGTTGDYVRLSHLYRTINDRENEGRILSQWLQTAPESTDARQAWADYQRRMGNYGEALAQYETMAAAMPDNPMPYRQMAEIYRRNGDYAMAEQQYETALAMRPGDISTMNRLAEVRYAAGDLQGALNVYTEIMAIEPGSRAAEQAERHAAQIERRIQQLQQ